jgi:hypothetical protein
MSRSSWIVFPAADNTMKRASPVLTCSFIFFFFPFLSFPFSFSPPSLKANNRIGTSDSKLKHPQAQGEKAQVKNPLTLNTITPIQPLVFK